MLDNYEIRADGVVKQSSLFNEIKTYDKVYVDERYNSYGELGMRMAFLRSGLTISAYQSIFNSDPSSIMDVGYGNGDYLRACSSYIKNCYGSDISGYPVPEGCTSVDDFTKGAYDIITFFDVLEHFEEIDFVKDLNCKMIIMSVPECHMFNDEWFSNWKHRRPDEHLYHFNKVSMREFFKTMGYKCLYISNIEDSIRKPSDEHTNIITGVFYK